jgi:hypothetical protein
MLCVTQQPRSQSPSPVTWCSSFSIRRNCMQGGNNKINQLHVSSPNTRCATLRTYHFWVYEINWIEHQVLMGTPNLRNRRIRDAAIPRPTRGPLPITFYDWPQPRYDSNVPLLGAAGGMVCVHARDRGLETNVRKSEWKLLSSNTQILEPKSHDLLQHMLAPAMNQNSRQCSPHAPPRKQVQS